MVAGPPPLPWLSARGEKLPPSQEGGFRRAESPYNRKSPFTRLETGLFSSKGFFHVGFFSYVTFFQVFWGKQRGGGVGGLFPRFALFLLGIFLKSLSPRINKTTLRRIVYTPFIMKIDKIFQSK